MTRYTLLFGLMLMLILPPLAAVAAGAPAPRWVETEGRAAVLGGDEAAARDAAVRDALDKALEQVVGLAVDSWSLYRKEMLVDHVFKARAAGYIRQHEILASRIDGTVCVVKVRALVGREAVEATLAALAAHHAVLVLADERNLGRPVAGQVIAPVLDDPFFQSAVRVAPANELRASGVVSALPDPFFRQPAAGKLAELSRRFLADLVVVAWADTADATPAGGDIGYDVDPAVLFPVAYASGNLTVYSGAGGKLVLTRRYDRVKGADSQSAERAGLAALGELARAMRRDLVAGLSAHLKAQRLVFEVRCHQGEAAAGRLAGILKGLRFVTDVETAAREGDAVTLRVTFGDRPRYFQLLLAATPGLRVERFNLDARTATVALD